MKVLDSSIHGKTYTIDAVCKNCTTWSLGSINKTSTKQPFIFGLGPTKERVSSDDMTATVPRHAVYGTLTLDMTQASTMNAKIPTTNTDNGSYVSSGSASINGGAQDDYDWSRPIHGVFMAVAFVLLFPSGVLVLRLLEHVLLHGIIQAVGWLFVIIGAGSGIYLSEEYNMVCFRLDEILFHPHASTKCFVLTLRRMLTRPSKDPGLPHYTPNHWHYDFRLRNSPAALGSSASCHVQAHPTTHYIGQNSSVSWSSGSHPGYC